MFHVKWVFSQPVLLILAAFSMLSTSLQAQNVNYSLHFAPAPSTYSWAGTNSTVITVTNNGTTTIPAGTTIYVENRMYTSVPGRTLAAVQTPPTILGTPPKVTLIPGSCVPFSYYGGVYAAYGCRVTLNSNFLPTQSFAAKFSFTLSPPGSPLIPGGPNDQLDDCGTGWLTTSGPWPGAFSGTGIQLPGWTFFNKFGGHGEVGCGDPPPPAKDVRISKTGGGTVGIGGSVNFTLKPFNVGPGTVNSVTVTDTLPPGLTSLVITSGPNWSCAQSAPGTSPQSLTCTYVGPAVGPWSAFSPPISISAIATAAGNFSNCADIILNGSTDAHPANNHTQPCASLTVTPAPKKDVKITKTGGATVQAGGVETFVIYPWNNGPASVTSGSVTITDALPPGLTSVTATVSGGTGWNCPTSGGSWTGTCAYTGPTVGVGPLPTIVVQGTATLPGSFSNCASIAIVGGGDVNLSDNGPSCKPYTVNPNPPPSDVAITKSGGGSVSVGSTLTFTLQPTNIGAAVSGGVTVTDILPSGLTPITTSGNTFWSGPWVCIVNGQTVTCYYFGSTTIPQGQPFPPITINTTATAAGSGTNCAKITLSSPTDVDLSNNGPACAPYTVVNLPKSDVSISKVGGGSVLLGNVVTFVLKPFNYGPDPASSIIVTDTLPAGLTGITFVAGTAWNCIVTTNTPPNTGSTLTCTYTSPPGTPVLPGNYFTAIDVQATANTAGTFQNCASVTLNSPVATDPNPSNNGPTCQSYTVTPPLSAACPVASGQLGVPYTSSIVVTGGTAPYTFAGALPPGLTLDTNTGTITGTPTVTGTYPFSVTVTDSTAGTPLTTTTPGCVITIAPAPLAALCPTVVSGQVNVNYSSPVTATGGTAPYTFTLNSGSWPPGLTLNSATGVISGTPTQAGTFPFSVQVTDVNGVVATTPSCGITIAPPPLAASCPAVVTGLVNVPYSSTVTATGGTAPYTFSPAGSVLPGLNLNSNGLISGTPAQAGTFSFSVTVTDSTGVTATAPACSFVVQQTGTVTIRKVANPQSTQAFHFTTLGQGLPANGVYLDDDGNLASGYSNVQTFTVPVGVNFTITEDATSGWDLGPFGNGTCVSVSMSSVFLANGFNATLLGPGSSIDCTFTNTKPQASLTITKVAQPNDDDQDFTFTTTTQGTGMPASFVLDDWAASTATPDSMTFTISPGVLYTITEPAVTGWALSSIQCTPSGSSVGVVPDTLARKVFVTLAPGANVTCTFTNFKQTGTITIRKVANPESTQAFHFSTSGQGLPAGGFYLDDDGSSTAGYSDVQTYTVPVGVNFTITEDAVSGWNLMPQSNNANCVIINASYLFVANGINITLNGNGGSLDCTFTNTKQASLTITKVAQPNHSQDFQFTTTGSGLPPTITLDDDAVPGGPPNSVTYSVTPGVTYTVAETQVNGWTLSGIQCNPGAGSSASTNPMNASVAVNLAPGASMTCTFTNTKSTTLTIKKIAQPNDPQDFEFTTTGSGLPPTITLDDDAAPGGPPNSVTYSVTPGVTYTVTETQVTGWTTNSIQCIPDVTGSSQSTNSATRTATVNLDPGTNMTCTFTNTH